MNNKNSKNKSFSPQIGVVSKGIFILILFLLFSFMAGKMMESGAEQRDEYYDLKDRCVSVAAVITNMEETEDIDGETEYEAYVSYMYNGRKYSNVFYRTYKTEAEYGEEVDIEIDPEDPKHILPKESGDFIYVLGIVGLCVICYFSVNAGANVLALEKAKGNWGFTYSSPYLSSQTVQKDVNFECYYTNQYSVWLIGVIAVLLMGKGVVNYQRTDSMTASFAYGIAFAISCFFIYRTYKGREKLLNELTLVRSTLLKIRIDSDMDGNDTTFWVLSGCKDWIPQKRQLVTLTDKTLKSFDVGDSFILAVDGKKNVQRLFDAEEFML